MLELEMTWEIILGQGRHTADTMCGLSSQLVEAQMTLGCPLYLKLLFLRVLRLFFFFFFVFGKN